MDNQDRAGRTALMRACRYDQPQTAQLIVNKGANLDIQSEEGWTALLLTCHDPEEQHHTKEGMLSCLKICYAGGARTDLVHKGQKRDALALAKVNKRNDIVDFLSFVLHSELAKVIVNELKFSRSILVALYDNGLMTAQDCQTFVSTAPDGDYEKLGLGRMEAKLKFKVRFGKKRRPTSGHVKP